MEQGTSESSFFSEKIGKQIIFKNEHSWVPVVHKMIVFSVR